ncbi:MULTISPECIES: NAD(P)/FAD-dependent oxidoreductase [Mesorhizobium]|uniref:NAD(P)/FAD-dependent oxidoreductase n=1 Tax=Mesorhizobium ciceri TaxID=39645 RepID=A0AB38TDP0_9HYPH|nr:MULTISPECIES: FAD/NAD(P)-binding oxidoreductase [Mesorhizobium]MDF3218562.1 FAD/NAD(P)-binding oxidoreductase [Mesorhizobium ciceri]UTU53109.1 NAD(P)/FAD-dependent oxidoreductase [Mesorhizobium ciceri]
MKKYDLVVIGAGPAGLAGALQAHELGLSVVILDDGKRAGGQIYRNLENLTDKMRSILGKSYLNGESLLGNAQHMGLDIRAEAVVWHISAAKIVYFVHKDQVVAIEAKAIMLATGALERPFPIPGWTLPGVMTAGAAQIAMKSGSAIPAGRIVLAGCGPLLYLVAGQLAQAGADVQAVLDTTPSGNYWRAICHSKLGSTSLSQLFDGIRMIRTMSAYGIRRILQVEDIRILGENRAEAVEYSTPRESGTIEADCTLLHQGVVPNIQLYRHLGCEIRWDDSQLCFHPVIDGNWQTSVPGIFAVGDNARIMGAKAAEYSARLAAFHIAENKKRIIDPKSRNSIQRKFRQLTELRKFIDTLYRPPSQFRIPPQEDTVICRCEEITAGEITDLAAAGCVGPNQAKFFTRCGMGPCQGRNCGLTVTELFAHVTGKSPDEVGYYTIRSPIRPLALAALAGVETSGLAADIEFS